MAKLEGRTTTKRSTGAGPLDELMANLDLEYRAAGPVALEGSNRAQKRRLTAQQSKCLLVRAAGDVLALPMENIVEILTSPPLAEIPNTPNWMLGAANLRGDVVSVCDLRMILGMPAATPTNKQRVVVVRSLVEEIMVSFVVDQVDGIRNLLFDSAVPPKIDLPESLAPFVRGTIEHDRNIFLVFDLERLLASPTLRQFEPA